MVFIYILELENKKYYIGKTLNPDIRLEQHFNSFGSAWTKKHKPKKILEIIPNCDNFDEDKYTIKYMEQFGIDNVRGGSFCEIKLNKDNLSTIKKMINGTTDKCYICGDNKHFAKDCNKYDDIDCYAKTTITGDKIEDSSDDEIEVFCCSYCNKEFDTLKGSICHENLYCKNKNNKKTITTNDENKDSSDDENEDSSDDENEYSSDDENEYSSDE